MFVVTTDSVPSLLVTSTPMPPAKSKRRQAIAPGVRGSDRDAALDIDLAEVDLRVDEMRAALESAADSARAAMRRAIDAALLRLPLKIKAMPVRTA